MSFKDLLAEVRSCTICLKLLPSGANLILSVTSSSRILIIDQAPGTKVHTSGIPWDDTSGKLLREWMQVDSASFYDEKKYTYANGVLLSGESGDLPPRPECAPQWYVPILKKWKI